MSRDVIEWLDANRVERAHVLGHSMGGKVAMRLACREPERVDLLSVVDIAPRDYGTGSDEVEALRRLDVTSLKSRAEADDLLRASIPDRAARQFLLMNLTGMGKADSAGWSTCLPSRRRSRSYAPPRSSPRTSSEGDALFVLGGRSTFVAADDELLIRQHFPARRSSASRGRSQPPHRGPHGLRRCHHGFAARKRK